MKGSSLVGLSGRGMRSVSGCWPSDELEPVLLVPLLSSSVSGAGERRSKYGFSGCGEPPLEISGLRYTTNKKRETSV